MISDVTEVELRGRGRRALARAARRRRLLGRVVRPLPAARPGARGRRSRKRGGQVELAKVDVDSNQSLAASFDVRGIPAVKAFRDGQVVSEFTGAIPPAQIELFLDSLVPSPADELAAAGDEASLREALELDPGHGAAAAGLGRILLARGDTGEALELLEPLRGDFLAEGLAARARLSQANGGEEPDPRLATAFAAWDAGDFETALETLQELIGEADDAERRDLIRAGDGRHLRRARRRPRARSRAPASPGRRAQLIRRASARQSHGPRQRSRRPGRLRGRAGLVPLPLRAAARPRLPLGDHRGPRRRDRGRPTGAECWCRACSSSPRSRPSSSSSGSPRPRSASACATTRTCSPNIGAVLLIVMGVLFIAATFVDRLNREWHVEALLARAGKGGPIVAGAAFSIAWTPCTGPGAGRHPDPGRDPGRGRPRRLPARRLLARASRSRF